MASDDVPAFCFVSKSLYETSQAASTALTTLLNHPAAYSDIMLAEIWETFPCKQPSKHSKLGSGCVYSYYSW